jgi:methionyl-tRNA formyltransferase
MVATGAKGVPQTGEASHYPRECPYGGEIDQAWKLEEIERFIRAMNYPPYPPARFDGKTVHSIDEYLLLISGGKLVT